MVMKIQQALFYYVTQSVTSSLAFLILSPLFNKVTGGTVRLQQLSLAHHRSIEVCQDMVNGGKCQINEKMERNVILDINYACKNDVLSCQCAFIGH